jgi:hypothetical protein
VLRIAELQMLHANTDAGGRHRQFAWADAAREPFCAALRRIPADTIHSKLYEALGRPDPRCMTHGPWLRALAQLRQQLGLGLTR